MNNYFVIYELDSGKFEQAEIIAESSQEAATIVRTQGFNAARIVEVHLLTDMKGEWK